MSTLITDPAIPSEHQRKSPIRKKKWKDEDDQELLTLARSNKQNWEEIASHFEGRTIEECQKEYKKLQKERTFTEKEDKELLEFGDKIESNIDTRNNSKLWEQLQINKFPQFSLTRLNKRYNYLYNKKEEGTKDINTDFNAQ